MNDLIISNNQQKAYALKTLASGFSQVQLLSRKAYGEKFDIKGKALKRAHSKYLLESGKSASAEVAKQIVDGDLLTKKITETTNGARVEFVRKSAVTSAKSFDKGAEKEIELTEEMKHKDSIMNKQWDKLVELGMTPEEIDQMLNS
jgi:hypothetical protein